ncbi:unnamed protein product [marine sediment metagenome]|uniref:Uncharacterized protein n=1 Tax=marine sediment metagenome TaxID=412755 RepID=X1SBU9_9ZZZZ
MMKKKKEKKRTIEPCGTMIDIKKILPAKPFLTVLHIFDKFR